MSKGAFFFGLFMVAVLIVSLYRAKDGSEQTQKELVWVEEQILESTREKALRETELSHLSRREWIEEYARQELGMGPPKPEQMAAESDLDLLIGPPLETGEMRVPRDTAQEAER